MADKPKTPDELRAEISRLDTNLEKIVEVERKKDAVIAELALAVFRGDKRADGKIDKHEHVRTSAMNWQRRLRAARLLLEAELERSETANAKADVAQPPSAPDLTIMETQNG